MPLYAFSCECGYKTEINKPMVDRDSYTECPSCGGMMKRQWGVGGVVIR